MAGCLRHQGAPSVQVAEEASIKYFLFGDALLVSAGFDFVLVGPVSMTALHKLFINVKILERDKIIKRWISKVKLKYLPKRLAPCKVEQRRCLPRYNQ